MIEFIQKNYPDAFPRTRFSAVSSMSQQGGGQSNSSNRQAGLPAGLLEI
jgi:hypothetical protein